MATKRVSWTSGAPTTEFDGYADLTSQSQSGNYSTITTIVKARNQGGTGSYSNVNGKQKIEIGGADGASHSGTLPSGVANDELRWSETDTVKRTHSADGTHSTDQVKMTISGWFSDTETANMPAYPRISKPPSAPGTPVVSNPFPTAVTLTWTASTNTNGSAITGYLVRYWLGPTATGTYVDASESDTLTRVVTGLKPGTQYTMVVYAHNGSYGGYSPASAPVTFSTVAPLHIRVGGVWKLAIPWVRMGGVWKVAQPFVRVGGVWKQTA